MSTASHRRRRTVTGRLVLVAISLAAACGGDDDSAAPDSTPRPTTTTTEPTTTTLSEFDQKIEAAKSGFVTYVQAVRRAVTEPVTPHLPEVQDAMTGDFKLETTAALEALQARGEASRLPENTQDSQEILSAELLADGSVHLSVCVVNDAVVYKVGTGAIVNDDVVTYTVDAIVVDEAGTWRVSSAERVRRQEGVASCAA